MTDAIEATITGYLAQCVECLKFIHAGVDFNQSKALGCNGILHAMPPTAREPLCGALEAMEAS